MESNQNREKRQGFGKPKAWSESTTAKSGKKAKSPNFQSGAQFIKSGGKLDGELTPLGSSSSIPKGSKSPGPVKLDKGSKSPK